MSTPAHVRQVLAKYRANPSVGLSFELPIYFQMDQDVCQVLTDEVYKHGAQWEVRTATPNLYQQIPACCGIYMFLFQSNFKFELANQLAFSPAWILYIGRAGSANSKSTLKDRYKGEYCRYIGESPEVLWNDTIPRNRKELLAKYLTIYPLQYWYSIIEDRSKIEFIEDRLIKLLNPPLNRQNRLKLRPLTSQPAFRSY